MALASEKSTCAQTPRAQRAAHRGPPRRRGPRARARGPAGRGADACAVRRGGVLARS